MLTPRDDRQALLMVLGVFAMIYLYFFQGGGWNQNSQFDTVRAIVEHGSPSITAFASNTGDVGVFKGRVYANKAPGLGYLGAPLYFLLYHGEVLLGIRPGVFPAVTFNAHVLTFAMSGIPAVAVLAVLYLAWRREGATTAECVILTTMFGAGSLVFPYSGVMVSQPLTTGLLFAAWFLITSRGCTGRSLSGAGLLAGAAIMTDYLVPPVVVLYLLYLRWSGRSLRAIACFAGGPVLAGNLLFLHNYLNFESPLVTNSTIQASVFEGKDLLFGMLGWPEPIRIVWLTVHPFRGLFYCCPVLLVALLARRASFDPTAWPGRALAVAVALYFFTFNLSFNGWTGGWGVGPRYLIPALPFLFLFALGGFRRYPTVSLVLAAVSALAMLSVATVQVMVPGPNAGEPAWVNPVQYCLLRLVRGEVSTSEQSVLETRPMVSGHDEWDSYNLGEVIGLPGVWSVLPVVALLGYVALVGGRLWSWSRAGAGCLSRVP